MDYRPSTTDHGHTLREIDYFFLNKDEPLKSCLLFLREHILGHDKNITEAWKYNMPFYFYKNERFCYLWVNKKTQQPYIGFTDGKLLHHPQLIAEKRSRMKIILLDAHQDLPVKTIDSILKMALDIYRA